MIAIDKAVMQVTDMKRKSIVDTSVTDSSSKWSKISQLNKTFGSKKMKMKAEQKEKLKGLVGDITQDLVDTVSGRLPKYISIN